MIEPMGYLTSLEEFLSRWYPTLKIFDPYGGLGRPEIWLPEDPGRAAADKAVDDAWERNR